MTTSLGRAPRGLPLTVPNRRLDWFGSVYAKTLRDARLSFMILAGLLAALLVSSGAAFGEAYSTETSRIALAALVRNLPKALAGVYGSPFPANVVTLGGSIAWKTGASLGLITAIWSILALSATLAGEARRGSLEFIAVTPLGARRIALEKLTAHLTLVGLAAAVVAITTWLAGALFGTLPGDAISPEAAVGYALWVGLVGLASGSVAFALGPFVGRVAAAGVAGAVLVGGYMLNGYQASVPAFAGLANLTWFGWTVRHVPLAGEFNWGSLALVALVTGALLVIGVEGFARRDLGKVSRLPWLGMPNFSLGIGGPTARALGERLPMAISWGVGLGLYGLVMGAAAGSFASQLGNVPSETLNLVKAMFPNIDFTSAGGFLQLAFVEFGLILAGFAAATLVRGWASDEEIGRLELLLTTPLARSRWAITGGVGLIAGIAVLTALLASGIAIGAAIGGGDIATPILGTAVLGLYAAALAGVGVAVGGLVRTSIAGEAVASIVIVTFLLDLIPPALKWPDWIHQLALTAHMGQPMIGRWDWAGIAACLVLAVGGPLLAGWGMRRRDVGR